MTDRYSTDGKLGVQCSGPATSAPQHNIGDTTVLNSNGLAIYGVAQAAIAANQSCTIQAAGSFAPGAGPIRAFVSAAQGQYLWGYSSASRVG